MVAIAGEGFSAVAASIFAIYSGSNWRIVLPHACPMLSPTLPAAGYGEVTRTEGRSVAPVDASRCLSALEEYQQE